MICKALRALFLTAVALSGLARADLNEAVQAVYKVGVVQADRETVVGSAVLVTPGKLITNCHTTRGAASIRILHPQGELVARLGKSDERRDLCLLLVPELTGPIPSRVLSSEVKQGAVVTAVGFGRGFRRVVQEGTVTALFPFEGAFLLRTSTVFPRGASGGGLFDDEGRLVGILTFRGTGGDDLNYALPVEWVETLLSDQGSERSGSKESLAFWEDGSSEQPFFLRATWLLRNKHWNELRAVAFDWVLREGESADAWYALGRAEMELGNAREAVIALLNAVQLRKDDGDAWYCLAQSYRELRYAAAFITAQRHLLELDPTRADDLAVDRQRAVPTRGVLPTSPAE